MNERLSSFPWIQCPSCWFPIPVPPDSLLGEHICANPTCPLGAHRPRIQITSTLEEALTSYEKALSVDSFKIGEVTRLYTIADEPLPLWGYFLFDAPISRFRLLEGQPLSRLVSAEFIGDWSLGLSHRKGRPFDASKEEGRAAGLVHAPLDRAGFQVRVDFLFDRDQLSMGA